MAKSEFAPYAIVTLVQMMMETNWEQESIGFGIQHLGQGNVSVNVTPKVSHTSTHRYHHPVTLLGLLMPPVQ